MRFRSKYITVRDSVPHIQRRLLQEGQLCDPREIYNRIWADRTFDGTQKCGLAPSVPRDIPICILYTHPQFPALAAVGALENHLRKKLGDTGLETLRRTQTLVLHRLGQFDSFGIRDLFIIYENGTIEQSDVTRGMFVRGFNFSKMEIQGSDQHESAGLLLTHLLLETPRAAFFLHVLGSDVRPGLVSEYIVFAPGYSFVGDQLNCRGLSIPLEQIRNAQVLAEMEEEIRSNSLLSYFMLKGYKFETVDHAVYDVFADGIHYGFNNRRAMKGMIERLLAQNPTAHILVHCAGSPIDFTLAEQLRILDISVGFVKRRSIRTIVDLPAKITYQEPD